jgi:hypothetical protein
MNFLLRRFHDRLILCKRLGEVQGVAFQLGGHLRKLLGKVLLQCGRDLQEFRFGRCDW